MKVKIVEKEKTKAGIDYGKYDKGGVDVVAPTTVVKVKVMPGTHGTEKGKLADALNRGKNIDKMMGYKKDKK